MVQRCPECRAAVEDAPWCGACGARLGDGPDGRAPSVGARPPVAWRTVAVVAVAVMGVAVLTRSGSDPDTADRTPADPAAVGDAAVVVPPALPSPGAAAGRQFAAEAVTLWERTDLPATPSDAAVVAAGEGHVLVGGRLLVPTPADTAGAGLLALPEPIARGAIATDGAWAVAELGWLVVGRTDESRSSTIELAGGWTPVGATVAWREGEPVLRGADHHLARVRLDGTIRWRTPEPLLPVGPVGERWLTGDRSDGTAAAVSLDDGRMVPLAELPLALHGDTAVVALDDDVEARDLATGEVLWRRRAGEAAWRTIGDHLAVVDLSGVARVDPRTGTERGRITGTRPVPATDTVVVLESDRLQATTWDGTPAWTVSLEAGTTHDVVAVDGARVAVTSQTERGTRVTVLRASDGAVLATLTAPVTGDRELVADGDVVAVMAPEGPVLTVDAATGMDVDAAAPPVASEDLVFGSGDGTVVVAAGSGILRGTTAGAAVWTLALDAPLAVPPIRSGPTLVVGLVDGTVAAIDPLRGEYRWQQDLGILPTAVAGDGTVLLVGTADGRVLRLDPEGRTVTRSDLGEGAVLSLVAGRPASALLGDRVVGIDVTG